MVSIQANSNLIVFTCLNNFIFDAMIKYKDYFLYNIFFLLEIWNRICFIRFWWPWANIQITWPSLNVITENDLHEEPWSSGGLLSTGETCVTGKVKPVPYYLQCPFTTSQQVMAPLHDYKTQPTLHFHTCLVSDFLSGRVCKWGI